MTEHGRAPLRIAVVGTGIVAALHLEAIDASRDAELVAVCDIDEGRAGDAARRWSARAWTDHREMFAAEHLDAVVITAPHSLHVAITLAAAEVGVAVLVEKPIATTLDDADAMITACDRAGVVLAVGHVLRFDGAVRAAFAAVESGRVGAPLAILHRRSAHYSPGSRPSWFFDPKVAGGGIAMNVGPHGVDRVQWLGLGRITDMTADVWHRGDLQVETDVIATARLDSGATASIILTSASLPTPDETVVVCQRGSVRYSSIDGSWILDGGGEELLAGPSRISDAFSAQLADLVEAVRRHRPAHVDGASGRSVLAAILGIYESSFHGTTVALQGPSTREDR